MPATEYRLFLNNCPVTRDQLDSVEEIAVEQEVDMAWEARLKLLTSVDARGNWQGETEAFTAPFARLRVEIKVGDKPFVPLIDGPVVGYDSVKSSQPGQSSLTLIVQDDSVYLNREERLVCYEALDDHEIAEQLFGEVEQITSTVVDTACPVIGPAQVVQRGTTMQLLRILAERQGFHTYVLPGEKPGTSVGHFDAFPIEPSDLPPLILLGREHNIESFNVSGDELRPAQTQAFSLRFGDEVVASSSSSFHNIELLGEEQAFTDEAETAIQLARPGLGGVLDPACRAAAETERSSYMLEASGQVLANCYPGVLRPYQVITVKGINDRLSGNYLVYRVTHTLTRSSYAQAFVVKRNARSAGTSSAFNDLVGSIF